MEEFRVGDRVRWDKHPELGVGTVVKEYPGKPYVSARFDDYTYMGADPDHYLDRHTVSAGGLKLVDEERDGPVGDDVTCPAHYNSGNIEVWDFIYDQGLGYALGNATKYITRAGKKAGNSKTNDLRKAIAFLKREIRFEETGE